MNRILSVAIFGLLSVGLLSGCGKDSASKAPPTKTAASAAPQPAGPAPNTEAVSKAAADFVDAVLKGDKERAIARLTPKSIENIKASGKNFGPPGETGATFDMRPVHMRTADQAVVPFIVSGEQMCCVLKLVDGDWRVYGLAYRRAPSQPWSSSDFETGKALPFALAAGRPATAARPTAAGSTRPSPPRTGEQPTAGVVR
jgi:hypothetical protein